MCKSLVSCFLTHSVQLNSTVERRCVVSKFQPSRLRARPSVDRMETSTRQHLRVPAADRSPPPRPTPTQTDELYRAPAAASAPPSRALKLPQCPELIPLSLQGHDLSVPRLRYDPPRKTLPAAQLRWLLLHLPSCQHQPTFNSFMAANSWIKSAST